VTPAVEAVDLGKRYRGHVALEGLSLTVAPGEVVGLLGPNGAGKTTTVKILLGLVTPTSGTATLFGLGVHDPEARRRVGYLPEQFQFPGWLTGAQLLEVHGRLAGIDAPERRARAAEVLDLVGLTGREDTRIGAYSKGMTQRAWTGCSGSTGQAGSATSGPGRPRSASRGRVNVPPGSLRSTRARSRGCTPRTAGSP